jgi:hypothetical protein
LRDLAAFIKALRIETVTCLEGYYQGTEMTDQSTEELIFFQNGKPMLIVVYGSMMEWETRSRIPAPISAIYDRMRGFADANARDWKPEKIEVMIWPYDHAIEPSIKWPKDWPGLNAPDTVKRGERGYSLYVPTANYDALIAFLKTAREKGAVEIGGRKWTASLRYPFPEERQWMRLRSKEGPPSTCPAG